MARKIKTHTCSRSAAVFTAALCAVFLLFAACEQPRGVVLDGDAALKSLSVSVGSLNPAFSASCFEYRVTVRNTIDSITVTAEPNSDKAVVSGDGERTLNEDINPIIIEVRAESGVSKTYTVTVTRFDTSRVIEITTAAEMANIGVDEGRPLVARYILVNDIQLADWSPIGNQSTPFAGEFDGNGKTITLSSFNSTAVAGPVAAPGNNYLGIFGYVKGTSASAKAAIKNLKINSSVNAATTAAKQAVGLLSGYVELAEIDDITLSGTFTFDSSRTILLGGIAGYINQTGTIIKDCNSSMTMNIKPGNGSQLLSGIQPYSYIGGFIGVFDNGAGIENCHNAGDVTAASAVAGSQVFAGGIAGGSLYAMSTVYKGYIKDSSFTGNILGKAMGSWTFAGGIAAAITGGTVDSLENTTRIERCFATGTVSVAGTISSNPYIGGIVGYNYYGALVSQCYFTGEVIADKPGDYTGGIAGYNSQQTAPNNSRVEDCWSSGTVTGCVNAGGIVGQNQVNTYLRRCWSNMNVSITAPEGTTGSASQVGAGGIAGFNASMETDAITACVALNSSISAPNGMKQAGRVIGNKTTAAAANGNYAWSGMAVTVSGVPADYAGAVNGTDCDAKPARDFYERLGWDFTNVWKMDSNGYPILQWQE